MALDGLLRLILLLLFTIFTLQFTPILSISESEALLKLKTSFLNATALASWAPGTTPCTGNWRGLVCYNGMVNVIRLERMGLSGNIDVDALTNISQLRTLSLSHNSFSGSIPEFNRLSSLKTLYLLGNDYSGEIPTDYFIKMNKLKRLWLSHNRFSGEIPGSLAQLSRLIALRLENNEFSGPIPIMRQNSLTMFNVSNNKLSGEIPAGLANFSASSFGGNQGLCGEQINKTCNVAPNSTGSNGTGVGKKIAGFITLAVMLILVVAAILYKLIGRKRGFDGEGQDETGNEAVETQVSTPVVRSRDNDQKPGTRKGGNAGRANMGEFEILNDEKGSFGMSDLMKAAAEVLGNGSLGSSYKATMNNGLTVVVKRMREMNAMGKDGFEAEMRMLGRVRHPNILTPLAFHYRKDEKLMIYEYFPKGSLLHILHDEKGTSQSPLHWPARLRIVKGIARGLSYLHSEIALSGLPHGNLKSSNVLITDDNKPLLVEFGLCPLINSSVVMQAQFAYKAPEVPTDGVSPKCDVYCLGIVILEILTGKFPSQYLSSTQGGVDVVQWTNTAISEGKEAELLDPEIASSENSIGEMIKLLHVGVACTESNPQKRCDIKEALDRIETVQDGSGGGNGSDSSAIQVAPDGIEEGHHEHSRIGSNISS